MIRIGGLSVLLLASGAALAETPSSGIAHVTTDAGVLDFQIEISDEPNERSRGLMFRDSLDDESGMLFIYPRPRIASFWMKNTEIPLDMLFIDSQGKIVTIAPQTVPHSLTPVLSDSPVIAVLEIAGGEAARFGIDVGDVVKWTEEPTAK